MTQQKLQSDDSVIFHVSRLSILFSYRRMVLKYRDKNISSLDDIQKLTAKDLREILKSHRESAGGTKADLVLKVFALLM